ncbi:uncharacterized protein LOC112093902, partial [Morus notabilis]|uniref:uncharacterized protein LOC112093902 n=1 Tax=Morus notabilis TaxID=981085 RepID=UPI000CECFDAA
YKSPKDLLYEIELQKGVIENDDDDVKLYEPEVGDIIAITSVIPKCVGDLDRPERSYLIGHVKKVKEKTEHFKVSIQLSKPTLVEEDIDRGKSDITLFAVKLINMTTNVRIWNALNSDPEAANRGILRNILQTDFLDAETCTICCSEQQYAAAYSNVRGRIHYSDLNESQKDVVLSCIRTRECHHQNTVKMIWGPPGTGQTKTVGFLLHLLLRMECRTLTCAPTNTAIVQVTKRVTEKAKDSFEFRKYGLGDIVLFGNRKRMKIDDYDDLYDVFLDHHVDMLQKCLSPKSGWEDSLHAMIGLLKEPEKQTA